MVDKEKDKRNEHLDFNDENPLVPGPLEQILVNQQSEDKNSIEGLLSDRGKEIIRSYFGNEYNNYLLRIVEDLKPLLNTDAVRSLADKSQFGIYSFIDPEIDHNRFDHSLFATMLAYQCADAVGLEDDDARLLAATMLLHDIPHGPFSHNLEPLKEQFHDDDLEKLINGYLSKVLNEVGVDKSDLLRVLNYEDEVLSPLAKHPFLGLDVLSYLFMDSRMVGKSPFNKEEYQELFEQLRFTSDESSLKKGLAEKRNYKYDLKVAIVKKDGSLSSAPNTLIDLFLLKASMMKGVYHNPDYEDAQRVLHKAVDTTFKIINELYDEESAKSITDELSKVLYHGTEKELIKFMNDAVVSLYNSDKFNDSEQLSSLAFFINPLLNFFNEGRGSFYDLSFSPFLKIVPESKKELQDGELEKSILDNEKNRKHMGSDPHDITEWPAENMKRVYESLKENNALGKTGVISHYKISELEDKVLGKVKEVLSNYVGAGKFKTRLGKQIEAGKLSKEEVLSVVYGHIIFGKETVLIGLNYDNGRVGKPFKRSPYDFILDNSEDYKGENGAVIIEKFKKELKDNCNSAIEKAGSLFDNPSSIRVYLSAPAIMAITNLGGESLMEEVDKGINDVIGEYISSASKNE